MKSIKIDFIFILSRNDQNKKVCNRRDLLKSIQSGVDNPGFKVLKILP